MPFDRSPIVVDLGCGDTFVAEHLAARHPDMSIYAIDTAFTDELIVEYRAHLNPRVSPLQSTDAIGPLEKPAALVLLMDVLEHIEDDRFFLEDLRTRAFVGQDTKFLITVPAYQALFCSHDRFLGHYRRYSTRSLRAVLDATGFRVIDIGYFFFSLLPIRLCQVLKERLLPVKTVEASTGLVAWNKAPAYGEMLRRLLTLDAHVSMALRRVAIRLGGLSNYAICMMSRPSDTAQRVKE